jgi:hypothetical protein
MSHYTAICFDSYWITIRHSYKIFKTQQFFKHFAVNFSEIFSEISLFFLFENFYFILLHVWNLIVQKYFK